MMMVWVGRLWVYLGFVAALVVVVVAASVVVVVAVAGLVASGGALGVGFGSSAVRQGRQAVGGEVGARRNLGCLKGSENADHRIHMLRVVRG